jgi:putative transposase
MSRSPPRYSAAIMDSQSVKTVEESASIRGYDAHKCVKGRKRHLRVATLGLPIACNVTSAHLSDPQGARRLSTGWNYFVPHLKQIWADAAHRGKAVAEWCRQQGGGSCRLSSADQAHVASVCSRDNGSWNAAPPD